MSNAGPARGYVERHGWCLVPIPAGSKAPTTMGWQKTDRAITTPEQAQKYWDANPTHNMGLLHSGSGTCAFDVDHVEWTKLIFEALGIDYNSIFLKNPRIIGNPARGKVLFAAPTDVALTTHKISWPNPEDPRKTEVIFELRAGAVQDVLPPSMHPKGYQYKWGGPSINDGLNPPPDQLLELWTNWSQYRDQLMDICPWAKKRVHNPTPRPRVLQDESTSVIDAYNKAYPIDKLLTKHGYKAVTKDRLLSPNSSSGLAGVKIFDDGKAYSHHASDPFDSAHSFDAFDVFTQYEHNEDVSAAVREAARMLNIKNNPVVHYGDEGKESQKSDPKKGKRRKKSGLELIPESLLTVPGALGDAVTYYNTSAFVDQPQFAVQAALAFGSTVCGRRWVTDQRNYTALYFMNVARTAGGKEHLKKVIEELLEASGISHLMAGGGYTSAAGFMSTLIAKPTHCSVIDEFGKFLESVAKGNDSNRAGAVVAIMEAFGRLDGVMRPTNYSTMTMNSKELAERGDKCIRHPSATLVCMTTPSTFYDNIDNKDVASGLLNRFIIVESVMPRMVGRMPKTSEVSERLKVWAKECANAHGGEGMLDDVASADIPPTPVTVNFTTGAYALLEDFAHRILHRMEQLEFSGLDAMVGRSKEQAQRVALIIAISKGEKEISAASVKWAIDYITFYSDRAIPGIAESMTTSELEGIVRTALTHIVLSGNKGVTEREMSRLCSAFRGITPPVRKQVWEMLGMDYGVTYNEIVTNNPKGGRKRHAYVQLEENAE